MVDLNSGCRAYCLDRSTHHPPGSYREIVASIHGATDLVTSKIRMIEAATVNAISTVMLPMAIERMYPGKRLIRLFLDNAPYRHAKLVQAWLAQPGRRRKSSSGRGFAGADFFRNAPDDTQITPMRLKLDNPLVVDLSVDGPKPRSSAWSDHPERGKIWAINPVKGHDRL
jgi:hypothetical protein